LIDPTLRREFQTLPLRVHTDRPTSVIWSINGRSVGNVSSESQLSWSLVPGTFEIMATDARGNSSRAVITVR
jgi:hypothetical protein